MWFAICSVALAADWPLLQGTEPAGAKEAVRPWGFVHVLGEGIVAGPPPEDLSPALSAFQGERATFDRIGSGDARFGLSVRRARFGLRGAIPGTDRRVAWLVAAELGDNGLTRTEPVVLTDASATVSYVPGLRVRAGQFKLPLGEEALEMNPIAAEFVNVSAATGQLLNENPVAAGAYTGGASGYRDLGVQAFDSFGFGRSELSYALVVSNGRMGALDTDDAKDVTGRLTFTPWVWGERGAVQRDELGVWVFRQQGRRVLDGEEGPRVREGVGLKFERSGWQARAELIHGAGMIELGPQPPFPGQPIEVAVAGRATGGYGYLHYERGHFGGGVRYDELWRGAAAPPDLRVFRTLTADVQVAATPRARLLLDYELRWLSAPDGSPDARAIAASLGDRVSVQAAVVF